ncbi:MAG: hypothetical protein IJS61_10910 [Firmicutes bacterium]|nr:hypothetical protein [Bacillota bacterium]
MPKSFENFIPVAKVGEQEKLLQEKSKGGIIEKREFNEEDHPRDENNQKFVPKDGGGDDSSVSLADKNADTDYDFVHKPINLGKKEYAEVNSEINTWYYQRFNGKRKSKICIGNWCYSFEIKEYGNYNFYEKRKNL